MISLFFDGLIINAVLILLFNRIPILTKSGWIHAGILGTLLWTSLGFRGWLFVVVYLVFGSLVTKIGFKFKKNLGIQEKREGKRGPENVWGSASTASFFAILYAFNIGNERLVLIGFAAAIISKLSDTFGSEIGKVLGKKTFLISTLKPVEPGTEGAISVEGTTASLIGSIIMTLVASNLSFIGGSIDLIFICMACFLSTLVESLIGAEFQDRYKLNNETVNCLLTASGATLAISFVRIYSIL